ncbi:hypothetical protein [Paralcaligenes sp. KSB-10]|uniref:hypothetical protein n=1 Tax=Paralcaligenes sp. KSB-10 TaxID=2901142 RepID=UPI00351CE404
MSMTGGFMRLVSLAGAAVLMWWLGLAPAMAGLCEVPFMHDGGAVQLTGSGGVQLGADLGFSNVKKRAADDCEAHVQGTATFGLGGLPPGKSRIDYWMTVRNGKASFERSDATGKRVPVHGKFDLRMLGLFAYDRPLTRSGQTFPAQTFQINVDHQALQTQPVVVHTGEKTVGERQSIQTAAGSQSCWPVRYTRVIDPTQASFNGLVLPIPGMTSSVTDWFCPGVNMVMKQESQQQGLSSVVEVSSLH